MKVSCIFTLNELKKIVPSLEIEHFKSDNPKVKEALDKLFFNLGCTLPDKIEIDEGLLTINRFGCIDDSPRITANERVDEIYLRSKWASNAVKLATNDVEMMRMIDQHRNQRSFSLEEN